MDPIEIYDQYTPFSEIGAIAFYPLNDDENRQDSTVTVENKELWRGRDPLDNGVNDIKMGATTIQTNCGTCLNPKAVCPGHPGMIELKYPVKSPIFREQLLKWLKVICHNCGMPVIKKRFLVPKSKLLSEYVRNSRQVKKCEYCDEPHPTVIKDKQEPCAFYKEYYEGKVKVKKEELFNHEIKKILDKVSDETVKKLGKTPRGHPRAFILDVIRVPPNTVRPDIRKIGGNRSNNSDITTLAKSIVETNESLPDKIPNREIINQKHRCDYYTLDATYFEMIKGSPMGTDKVHISSGSGRKLASLASRIPKKKGRLRGNIMGRRCHNMVRSVITGDNSLKLNEIGVPIKIAKTIQIPMTVTSNNRDQAMTYFMNSNKIYPGCSRIIKKSNGKSYRRANLPDDYQLQNGDVIERDMINGDVIGFNRQPSLLFSNIACHKVVVLDKSGGDTLHMNVSACSLYNADSTTSGSE